MQNIKIKKNSGQKFLALLLSFLLLFNPVIVPFVLAQELNPEEPSVIEKTVQDEESSDSEEEAEGEGNDEEEAEQQLADQFNEDAADHNSDLTPTPSLSISPASTTDSSTTIQTGEANAQAEGEIQANINETLIPGEITDSQNPCALPTGETTCPQPVVVNQENSAVATDSAAALANSGENTIDGASGEALIDTGNATAGAQLDNEINTNLIILTDGENAEQLLDQPTVVDEGNESDENNSSQIIITNENSGDLTNQADVLANSGENNISKSLAGATIKTGDALAWANILNLLNANIIGSDFQFYFLNILDANGDIDLNDLWGKITSNNNLDTLQLANSSSQSLFSVENVNFASLVNEINVAATSGGNIAQENQGDVLITTGDAIALANVLNFVNLNFIGSKFLFGGINILGSFVGNIILPRPDRFAADMLDETEGADVFFEAINEATLGNMVSATANTGSNTAANSTRNNTMQTGEAISRANSLSFVNLSVLRNNWFFFNINNLGSWLGQIFNWSVPGVGEDPVDDESIMLQVGVKNQTQSTNQNFPGDDYHTSSVVSVSNHAQVQNNIQVSASTGDNQAINNQGETKIITGTAKALANLLNFVNLNIWGSHWFGGLLNILGSWTGDIIFAYPDVAVSFANNLESVSSDEIFGYTVNFRNQGYDEANNVQITIEIPQGVIFIGDSTGISPIISGRFYTWDIGRLGVGEQGSFIVIVKMDPDYHPQQHLSFWEKLIPPVWAAENTIESRISLVALAKTSDPETDFSNNFASAVTIVHYSINNTNQNGNNNLVQVASDREEVDQRQPLLEVTASNNVGEFVYPGDTVTFEIKIKNIGEGPADDVYLTHRFFDHLPEDLGTGMVGIGSIDPGKTINLSFGMELQDGGLLPAGFYFTETQAIGFARNGKEIFSNKAITQFEIRPRNIFFPNGVKAVEPGGVLGASENFCLLEKDILPYVLLLLLSTLWISEKRKKITFWKNKKLIGVKSYILVLLEIITLLIVLASFGYALYKVLAYLNLLEIGIFGMISRHIVK